MRIVTLPTRSGGGACADRAVPTRRESASGVNFTETRTRVAERELLLLNSFGIDEEDSHRKDDVAVVIRRRPRQDARIHRVVRAGGDDHVLAGARPAAPCRLRKA